MVHATAPAKIILCGEHAVVYGQPAIAVPVSSLRVSVTVESSRESGIWLLNHDTHTQLPLDTNAQHDRALALAIQLVLNYWKVPSPDISISIHSQIPVASGLGSGAAVSTALMRALAAALDQPLDDSVLNQLVYEVEKVHHGTPSGIDNTVIVYEKPVYFIRGQAIETFTIKQPFSLLIGDTGQSALTRIAVSDVRKLYDEQPQRFSSLFRAIGDLVQQARRAIEEGYITQLGRLMNENQAYLREMTVSSPELEKLIQAALAAGALGAKLSGGGRGGNMITLVSSATPAEVVRQALLKAGAKQVFETTVG